MYTLMKSKQKPIVFCQIVYTSFFRFSFSSSEKLLIVSSEMLYKNLHLLKSGQINCISFNSGLIDPKAHRSPLFQGPSLIIGGSVNNRGYPVQFFPLCRVGVTIISFSSIHLVITRPALYKKKPTCRFEINEIIFRPYFDMSRGVFGLPGKNKNER